MFELIQSILIFIALGCLLYLKGITPAEFLIIIGLIAIRNILSEIKTLLHQIKRKE